MEVNICFFYTGRKLQIDQERRENTLLRKQKEQIEGITKFLSVMTNFTD